MHIKKVGELRCQVGEGPLWDERAQQLYFVDIVGQCLWRLDPASGRFASFKMPQMIAAVALTDVGGVIVLVADGYYQFNPATGTLAAMAQPALATGTQFNDGKVDRQGRFIGATMERSMKVASGAIYSFNGSDAVLLEQGYVIGNGPCWSKDGRTFYCSDSVPKKIYAYDYDPANGSLSRRREFADTTALGGIPDGATVDSQDRMWMAICGGGKVVAFTPDGRVERMIEMPTPWVSSVMFGGPQLDQIYVTSLDPTLVGLPADPQAGYLYVIEDSGARGLVEPRMLGGTP
jgi:sugar lactone lactonase YvrE